MTWSSRNAAARRKPRPDSDGCIETGQVLAYFDAHGRDVICVQEADAAFAIRRRLRQAGVRRLSSRFV